jgi:hypothetical protein
MDNFVNDSEICIDLYGMTLSTMFHVQDNVVDIINRERTRARERTKEISRASFLFYTFSLAKEISQTEFSTNQNIYAGFGVEICWFFHFVFVANKKVVSQSLSPPRHSVCPWWFEWLNAS